MVADGSKIGQDCLARICDLSVVGELITDSPADPDAVAALVRSGMEVIIADAPQ